MEKKIDKELDIRILECDGSSEFDDTVYVDGGVVVMINNIVTVSCENSIEGVLGAVLGLLGYSCRIGGNE